MILWWYSVTNIILSIRHSLRDPTIGMQKRTSTITRATSFLQVQCIAVLGVLGLPHRERFVLRHALQLGYGVLGRRFDSLLQIEVELLALALGLAHHALLVGLALALLVFPPLEGFLRALSLLLVL